MTVHQRIEKLWWSDQRPPLLLRAFEPLYAAMSRHHLEKRISKVSEPPIPLISVGNITVGGSGKTPFVIWLAGALRQQGFRPVILCRGDGGSSKSVQLVDQGTAASVCGDEAKLLAELSDCPVIAGRDRIAGSHMAAAHGDLIILDDGFQYRHLGRCCDIVMIPAEGVGNGHQIPAGPLREPLEALNRADLIVRSGSHEALSSVDALSDGREWHWISSSGTLFDAMQLDETPPASLHAVTAIARPDRFFATLEQQGVNLTARTAFPDHHQFSASEVSMLPGSGDAVAVTAKDAVKLKPLWPKDQPLWVLPYHGEGEPGLLDAILARINTQP